MSKMTPEIQAILQRCANDSRPTDGKHIPKFKEVLAIFVAVLVLSLGFALAK